MVRGLSVESVHQGTYGAFFGQPEQPCFQGQLTGVDGRFRAARAAAVSEDRGELTGASVLNTSCSSSWRPFSPCRHAVSSCSRTTWQPCRSCRADHPAGAGTTASPRALCRNWRPPPHARGPWPPRRRPARGAGTTPAGAGTTFSACPQPSADGDHPRTCGERWPVPSARHGHEGPPPHTPGARQRAAPRAAPAGTTPARAGSTW